MAIVAAKPEGHAIGAQEIMLWQTELHGIEAENIGHQKIMLGLFPLQDILPLRGGKPVIETAN